MFIRYRYIGVIVWIVLIMSPVKGMVLQQTNLVTFACMMIIVTLVYNAAFVLVFRKTAEFAYLWALLKGKASFLRGRKV